MKLKLLLMSMFLPYFALAQKPATVGVERQVDSLLSVAEKLMDMGKFSNSLNQTQEAERLVLEKSDRETASYAKVCSTYGRLFFIQMEYDQAEKWLLEAVDILGKTLGETHESKAKQLNILGMLYENTGNYPEAQRVYFEAKNIYQTKLGISDLRYTGVVLNLATLYAKNDESDKAEALFLEVKDLFESGLLDKGNRYYSICLNNLANVYSDLGLFQKAKQLFLQSLEIVKNDLGESHPEYARSLSNLARNYIALAEFDAAVPLLLQAKTIMENAGKTEAAVYSEIIGNLGTIYMELGQLELAEPFVLQSLAVEEKLSGRMHYRTAFILGILAELNRKKGDAEKSEALFHESLAILKTTLGEDHPVYINTLHSLIDLYWTLKRFSEAISLTEEAWEGEQLMDIKSMQHMSEAELSESLKTFTVYQNTLYSYSQSQPALSATSFDNALFHKGFLLKSIQQLQGMAARYPAFAGKFIELKSLQAQLFEQYAAPIANRDSTAIANLEAEANALEKQLSRDVAGYGEAIHQVRWQEVQAALKPGEAAIEFVDYQFYDPEFTDSVMFAALVILPLPAEALGKTVTSTAPQFIPLFEKNELLPLLHGATGGNNFLKINALYTLKPAGSAQKSLHELIWKPLEKVLKNSATVYCSPSGLLHYLNLAAIPTPNGKTFGDNRHLVRLGSTRNLVLPTNITGANMDAYLAGGIRYDTDSIAISYALRDLGTRSVEITSTIEFQPDSASARAGALNYLPATATEVREIGQMLRTASFSTKIDTGFYATEEAFRSLGVGKPSPRIVHLATHGYFFPDPKGKNTKDNFGQEPVFKMSEHPMIRSGLILAGAKQAWLTGKHPEGQEDGVLTAYEISQMNLSNTELVVLSACETGLGQVSGTEGVYGLQRAFKIAGVKYLIMSLWKVDDRSTQTFMAEFYRQWLQEKRTIPQAFQAAQKSMRAQSPNPYDWAGFVLIE